jgi:hypothetical protein
MAKAALSATGFLPLLQLLTPLLPLLRRSFAASASPLADRRRGTASPIACSGKPIWMFVGVLLLSSTPSLALSERTSSPV